MTPMTFVTTVSQNAVQLVATKLYLFSVTLHSVSDPKFEQLWYFKSYNRILTCYNRQCLNFSCMMLSSGRCFMHIMASHSVTQQS